VRIALDDAHRLRFTDGSPVRATSALARLGDGWLVAQDDATHAARLAGGRVERLRLLPPVQGLDVFSPDAGTKHLKPDLEAACAVDVDGDPAAVLLGSGSTVHRRGAVLVVGDREPAVRSADLGPLYDAVAAALAVPDGQLNVEGAAVVGDRLRLFQRGNLTAGVASGSVDVDLAALLDAVRGRHDPGELVPTDARQYALGDLGGVGLAVTDAVALPDGRLLVSAAAEDTSNPVDDGRVVGSMLALLDGDEVRGAALLPEVDGAVQKVEGLGLLETGLDVVRLLCVVDADDPEAASVALTVTVTGLPPSARASGLDVDVAPEGERADGRPARAH
jgi:hypothetical protein